MTDTAKSRVEPLLHPRPWLVAVRPAHWIKNLLLVAPLLFAQIAPTGESALRLALGFILMCCVASAGYLANDLLDRAADRHHATKKRRPIAAGVISVQAALTATAVLSSGALLLAWLVLGPDIALLLALYLGGTLSYSVWFKRRPYVDVVVLAGLYLWRLVIGGQLTGVELSGWLLLFGYALFVALALVKRLDELAAVQVPDQALEGRGYRGRDRRVVLVLCVLFSALATATLGAYVGFSQAATINYRHHVFLWVALLLLGLWLARVTRCAARGRLGSDPVMFAITDPRSLLLAAGIGLMILVAI